MRRVFQMAKRLARHARAHVEREQQVEWQVFEGHRFDLLTDAAVAQIEVGGGKAGDGTAAARDEDVDAHRIDARSEHRLRRHEHRDERHERGTKRRHRCASSRRS